MDIGRTVETLTLIPCHYDLPKLHKPFIPVMPVVSFMAKFLDQGFESFTSIQSKYFVQNTLQLAQRT